MNCNACSDSGCYDCSIDRIKELEAAIRKHRDQKGDDRCWLDDEELYNLLPEGFDSRQLSPEIMLKNCAKFVASRHNPSLPYLPNLFQQGSFNLAHSQSGFKIECDALSVKDWETLAYIASTRIPPFKAVYGIPRGGEPLAAALLPYRQPDGLIAICDDVWTTGRTMLRELNKRERGTAFGVIAFARRPLISKRVYPLFTLSYPIKK